MAATNAALVGRHGSTLSILWGVLLVVFGFIAIGAPFLAAKSIVSAAPVQQVVGGITDGTPAHIVRMTANHTLRQDIFTCDYGCKLTVRF